MDLDILHTSIVTRAQEVIQYLYANGYNQDDFADLEASYNRLKQDRLA